MLATCHVTSVYNSSAATHARHVQHQDQSAGSLMTRLQSLGIVQCLSH